MTGNFSLPPVELGDIRFDSLHRLESIANSLYATSYIDTRESVRNAIQRPVGLHPASKGRSV
jgi:hypothetical protein